MEIKGFKKLAILITIIISLFLFGCEEGELWHFCKHLTFEENKINVNEYNEIIKRAPKTIYFKANNKGVITFFNQSQEKFTYKVLNDKGDYELNIRGDIEKISIEEISNGINKVKYHDFNYLVYTLKPCTELH
jgi:hypothetical protein